MFLLEPSKRAHPIFPVSHQVVIPGLTAVTLDRSSTHELAFFRAQSETSHSPNPLTNNPCHKEPVTLPPREKCFEAAIERRASSLRPAQHWVQQPNFTKRGGTGNPCNNRNPWTLYSTDRNTTADLELLWWTVFQQANSYFAVIGNIKRQSKNMLGMAICHASLVPNWVESQV